MKLSQFWSNPWHPEIGFSGSREGMTKRQKLMVHFCFKDFAPSTFHHGDCVGSDESAHRLYITHSNDTLVHIHHASGLDRYKAHCRADINHPAKPPLERNHDIVDASDIMLFTPKEDQPVLRSGTWATFRYALSLGKPMVLIQPSGHAIFYDGGKEVMQTNVATLTNATGGASFTANATGTALAIDHTNDGYFCFYATGTFGSGTAKLQVSLDGTTYVDVTGASLTADGYKVCQVFGRFLRAVLSGATTPVLSIKVAGVNTGLVRTNS